MLTKKQSIAEKQLIKEMSKDFSALSEAGKAELIRLKCRNELLTFCVIMSKKLKGDRFKPFDVHRLVCEFVQLSADGISEYDHTTVSLPPRTGKSTIISQYLPAWQLGRNPKSRYILGSHTLSLVEKNSARVLEIISHPEYKRIFPHTKVVERGVKVQKWSTTEKGGLICGTPKIKISGFDAGTLLQEDFPGLIILDDLVSSGSSKAELETSWNWIKEQLITRTLPNIAFISMGTRFSISDPIGRLLETAPEVWKTLNVPAICEREEIDPLNRKKGESFWEEFYPVKDLHLKKAIMQDEFRVIYQGQPEGTKGNIVQDNDIIKIDKVLPGSVFFSIDTNYRKSEAGDYNSVCIWSRSHDSNTIQLIDVFHSKCDFSSLLSHLKQLIKFYNPKQITVEAKANGDALISLLTREFPNISFHPYNPTKDKVSRFNLASPHLKSGKVTFFQGIKDLDTYIKELLQFPYSIHDDFSDSFSLGIIFWYNILLSADFDSSFLGFDLLLEQIGKPVDVTPLELGYRKNDLSWRVTTNFL